MHPRYHIPRPPPAHTAPLGGLFTVPHLQPHPSTRAPTNLSTNPPTPAPNPHAHLTLLAAHARARNRAVWSHALVLFTAFGLPLSCGVSLEAQFTSLMPQTALTTLAMVVGGQLLFVFCMPGIVGCVYVPSQRWGWWRSVFLLCGLGAAGGELAMRWVGTQFVLVFVVKGVLVPALLGVVVGVSWVLLARHYRWNLSLVSLQCWFAAFLGGVVYAVIERQGPAHGVSAGVMVGTLVVAWMLVRPVKEVDGVAWTKPGKLKVRLPKGLGRVWKEEGTVCFILGYIMVFFSVFVLPVYLVLILTQPPTLYDPAMASWALVAMLSTAAFSASISANPKFRRRLGPADTFSVACVWAGAVSIFPAWVPINIRLVIVASSLYGIGLGSVLALHIRVSTVFHAKNTPWQSHVPGIAAIMMVLGGIASFAGLLMSAWILEGFVDGVKIAISTAAGCLVGGGMIISFARSKRCSSLRTAI